MSDLTEIVITPYNEDGTLGEPQNIGSGTTELKGQPIKVEVPPVQPPDLIINLTDKEAVALWDFFQSDDCPNYWETPLSPLADQLKTYYKYDSKW